MGLHFDLYVSCTAKPLVKENMTAPDDRTWYIIPCPSSVTLTQVDKERGTHGSIYVLWDIDEKSPVWVGQSIPALVRSVNEKAVINKEKRLHASSLYRCLRGEARKQHHKSWKVDKYSRDALPEMNRFLGEFPSVVYVSKSPELWRCTQGGGEDGDVPHPTDDTSALPGNDEEEDATGRHGTSSGSSAVIVDRDTGRSATDNGVGASAHAEAASLRGARSSSSIFDESDGRVVSFEDGLGSDLDEGGTRISLHGGQARSSQSGYG
jgi:hypothetical protein